MQQNSMMMIHNAHTVSLGDRHAMAATAQILGKVDDALAMIYASRSHTTPADAHRIMDKETWLTATEALAQNYCDEVVVDAPVANEIAAKLLSEISAAAPPATSDPTSCMACIIDAMESLTEAMDCLMPQDDETGEDMQMSIAREIRLRKLQLIALD